MSDDNVTQFPLLERGYLLNERQMLFLCMKSDPKDGKKDGEKIKAVQDEIKLLPRAAAPVLCSVYDLGFKR